MYMCLLCSISTFVCPTEILAFSDRIDEFQAIKTEVVACSVDSKYTHFAWINTKRDEGGLEGLQIPLLSDLTQQISKDYGVLLEDEGHTLRYAVAVLPQSLNQRGGRVDKTTTSKGLMHSNDHIKEN